jgi:ABC-type Fe3+/spermidine/putrescine transport system ATPase subunit
MTTSANSDPPFLLAAGIEKAFDALPVLRGIDLSIADGETVCLLGPSGCGKTTLLRVIAGLEQADRGRIICADQDITQLPPHRRDFGLMFQDFVLFPHLTVAENIAFGLKMHGWPAGRVRARVAELLELVDLPEIGQRRVFELSGGQQQRVALARSLAPQPRLLMLDEPLASLDRVLRDQLLADLRALLERLGQTALYVTHDQLEAFAIADRVILINEGRIEQEGPPGELYRRPASAFVARFLGFKNFAPGRILQTGPAPMVETALGRLHPPDLPAGLRPGEPALVVIRPEGLRPAAAADADSLTMPVVGRSFRGSQTSVRLQAPDSTLMEFVLPGDAGDLRLGESYAWRIDPQALVVLSSDNTPPTL